MLWILKYVLENISSGERCVKRKKRSFGSGSVRGYDEA